MTQPISPLMADLIGANMDALNRTTNTLIDSLSVDLAKSHATVDAIRDGVIELLSGDYMPTPAAIERALYPSAAMVDRFRVEGGAS
jgi:hypothetical protein